MLEWFVSDVGTSLTALRVTFFLVVDALAMLAFLPRL